MRAIKVVLISDRFVQITGGDYENTSCGQLRSVGSGWEIRGDEEVQDDGKARLFPSAMAAALTCAAEYVALNEGSDESPSAHKIHG